MRPEGVCEGVHGIIDDILKSLLALSEFSIYGVSICVGHIYVGDCVAADFVPELINLPYLAGLEEFPAHVGIEPGYYEEGGLNAVSG